jgi:hypothetical protein
MTFSSNPTMADFEEKTEVIYGVENIIKDTIERISLAKECIDACMHGFCRAIDLRNS